MWRARRTGTAKERKGARVGAAERGSGVEREVAAGLGRGRM